MNQPIEPGQQWLISRSMGSRVTFTIVSVNGTTAIGRYASGNERPFSIATLSRGLRGARLMRHADGTVVDEKDLAVKAAAMRREGKSVAEIAAELCIGNARCRDLIRIGRDM